MSQEPKIQRLNMFGGGALVLEGQGPVTRLTIEGLDKAEFSPDGLAMFVELLKGRLKELRKYR